jgi:hypothetical protein
VLLLTICTTAEEGFTVRTWLRTDYDPRVADWFVKLTSVRPGRRLDCHLWWRRRRQPPLQWPLLLPCHQPLHPMYTVPELRQACLTVLVA